MARPRAEIDEKMVAGMATVGATNVEIAEACGVSEGTIRHRFYEILTKSRSVLKTKLRRAQLRAAFKGNSALLIFLGKNMLGQADKIETKNEQNIVIKEKSLDTSPRTDERAGVTPN